MSINLFDLKPWQFYSLEYAPDRKRALEWYYERKEIDNYETPQLFRKAYIDIEVFTKFSGEFPDPEKAEYPVVLISLTFSDEDKVYAFCYLNPKYETHKYFVENREELKKYLEENINKHYSPKLKEIFETDKNIEVELFIYTPEKNRNLESKRCGAPCLKPELQMIKDFFKIIHEKKPFTIAGYYSDGFDFPYLYNRLIKLGVENPGEIISKFNHAYLSKNHGLQTPDYMFVDILYMYKPGDGLGFGDTQESYELDNIANIELGIKKVELKTSQGKDFDLAYRDIIQDYIFYNIVDTLLVKALDKKLDLIYTYNSLRRMSKSLFKMAYRGATKYGEDIMRNILRYTENAEIRSFIPKEKFPYPSKMDKFKEFYYSVKIFGAYVKETKPSYKTGVIIDLDQSLTGDQLILIKRRGKIIETPISKYQFQKGDETLTLDRNNRVTWKPVKGKIKHKRKYRILKIRTKSGAVIKITENHSIFVYNNEIGEIELKNVSNIKVGDKLILVTLNKNFKKEVQE